MKKFCLIGLSALALTACNGSGTNYDAMSTDQAEADFNSVSETVAVQPTSKQAANGSDARSNNRPDIANPKDPYDPAGVFLAYRYSYGLVMPATSVKATADKHIQICREAGPRKCQVTGSNTNSHSDENIRAHLSLRADPDWLVNFVSDMKVDIAEIDGRIENENTSVEDLTRSILDTDARLKAKRSLRTRLEGLLETRDAKLPDLLALERELARVQGDIESATANLKALRARVSMSVVNISYTSERLAVSRSSVSPIGAALKDFVNVIANGIAGVIYFFAYMLPWMIFLILPGFFAGRWIWRRRKESRRNTQAKNKKTSVN